MNFNKNKKIFLILFCYFVLYLITSNYMYSRHDPNMLATSFDAGRYVGLENFFAGHVGVGLIESQNVSWHLFFTYTLFIRTLEKLNLISHYVEVQYIIFYFSSFLFYKSLINFNFTKFTSFCSVIFVICNPFLIFWIHTINHAGITLSLFMISFYFLSKYDEGKIFKILFFIFLFFTIKVDGKVFFTAFMMLFYKFYLIEKDRYLFNLLGLIIFFILYFFYLNKFAVGLASFSASYFQDDIMPNEFIAPLIDSDAINTYAKCSIYDYNSLINHFCALLDNPSYSLKLYFARFFLLLTWINTYLSFKYNFFAFGMMIFLYFGLIVNLLKTKFTKFKFFLLSSYFLTIVMLLPYIIRGDQKQVFYGLVFIVPLSFSGYEILYKYFKKNLSYNN